MTLFVTPFMTPLRLVIMHTRVMLLLAMTCLWLAPVVSTEALAQGANDGWAVTPPPSPSPPIATGEPPPQSNTTEVERSGGAADAVTGGAPVPLRLVAQLIADGQPIDRGLIWRVFGDPQAGETRSRLVSTLRDASPIVKLAPGTYSVNVSFGKANLTRRITVKPMESAEPVSEVFVLNAGGLRVTALVGTAAAAPNLVTYSVLSDRDQSDNRKVVLQDAKPGLIVRLNAGIYQIVSKYGDCNAIVQSDVTVEAGKLTEAQVTHAAAKVTFRLVQRAGGEALPDTHWVIQSSGGAQIKTSAGALPTHILAPGSYTVNAKSQGRSFQRDFKLQGGDVTEIELVMAE